MNKRPRTTLNNFLSTATGYERRVYRAVQRYEYMLSTGSKRRKGERFSGNVRATCNRDPRIDISRWKHFEKVIDLCAELSIDVDEYLEAQFSEMTRMYGFAPYPNQLHGEAAVNRLYVYASAKAASEDVPEATLTHEQRADQYKAMLRRAKRQTGQGFSRRKHLKEGLLAGVYPTWFVEEQLGVDVEDILSREEMKRLQ